MITEFKVDIESMDQTLDIGTDESYEITVLEKKENEYIAQINAKNCFGVLKAFETFSQLIEIIISDDGEVSYQISQVPLTIRDAPRFPWRFVFIQNKFLL